MLAPYFGRKQIQESTDDAQQGDEADLFTCHLLCLRRRTAIYSRPLIAALGGLVTGGDVARKRNPRYGALFVIGLAFIAIGVSTNVAFVGIGIAFLVIGAAGMRRSREAGPDKD